jgi:hypothetical protein
MQLPILSSEFFKTLDFPVALSQAILGVGGLLYARKNRELIMKKVEAGDYSEAEGKKKDRTFRICSYGILLIGSGLLLNWYLER